MKDPHEIVARCVCCDEPVRRLEMARGYDHPEDTEYHIAIIRDFERPWVLKESLR